MRRPAPALSATLATTVLFALGAGLPATANAQARPNIVVIMTDDQAVSQLERRILPLTFRSLVDHGSVFTNSVVSSPLCCPSRAGLLTGQYPHNNGVYDNEPGYPALTQPGSTLYSWLDAAGYRTGHIGRFLLGYPEGAGTLDGAAPAPGVDHWFGYADTVTYYYNALFSDNGALRRAGFHPHAGYTTEVINREAREFVAAAAPSPQPFFLWVAHVAPHTVNAQRVDACGGGTPVAEPGTFDPYRKEPLPRPPSFDEQRISDKPRWVRSRPPLPADRLKLIRRGWRCALASLASVDRGVAELVAELGAAGELDETAIFFTSDNGLLFGEHRLVQAKGYPYEETLRVPLVARVPAAFRTGPKRRKPPQIDVPVTNLDLSATILDLAQAQPCAASVCRTLDGRSLVPLLSGRRGGWPAARATLVEVGNRTCTHTPGKGLPTFYDAVRTRGFIYVQLRHAQSGTGTCDRYERELYDLRRDPYQLENLAVNPKHRRPSPIQRRLRSRLARLRQCAGIAGRDAPLAGRPRCE